MNLFTWKGMIFSSASEASKLKIKWFCPSTKYRKQYEHFGETGSNVDNEFIESSDHERGLKSDTEDSFINHMSPFREKHFETKDQDLDLDYVNGELSENRKTEYHFNVDQHYLNSDCDSTEIELCSAGQCNGNITIIAEGFSYDPHNSVRVPVFLVQDKSLSTFASRSKTYKTNENGSLENLPRSSSTCRLVLASLLEDFKPKHTKSLLEIVGTAKCEHSTVTESKVSKKTFKLNPIRTFWLADDFTKSLSPLQNITFVSNYGFLYVNCVSRNLSLCFGSSDTTEKAEVQHFVCDDGVSDKHTILVYDLYNCFESQSFVFIALMSDENGDESNTNMSKSCVVLYFHPNQFFSKKFEMKHIQLKKFFPQEFAHILLSFSILSTFISCKDARVLSSSLIMVTTTGFAIRFMDGEMMDCVRLSCDIKNFDLRGTNISVIDIDNKSDNKSLISVNNTCDILDWSKKKILSSYSNVSFISKLDSLCNGCPSILLLFYPDSGPRSELCVKDLIPLIIDQTEFDSNIDNDKKRLFEPEEDQSTFGPLEDIQQNDSITKTVLTNLVSQKKKCQSELKEAEQVLENKKIFIENLQRKFSNELSLSSQPNVKELYLQPLIPLTEESVSASKEKKMATSLEKCLKYGEVWKRTVNSVLICGVEVTNTSRAGQISEIHLTLLPINPQSSFIRCTSKVTGQDLSMSVHSASPLQKKICLENEGEDEALNSRVILGFNESASLVGYTDTSHLQGGENIIFKVLVTYKLCDAPESLSNKKQRQSVCCGQFSLSAKEIISQCYSLKSQLSGSNGDIMNKEDILALDCVQKCQDLEIKSVMTSVLSLQSGLKLSSVVQYIHWADQYIFSQDHILQYCRIKWLNQRSKYEAKIRVFARSQADFILLVQFMYSLVPKDLTITIPWSWSCSQPSISTVKNIGQSIVDRVDNSMADIKKKLCHDEQKEGNENHIATTSAKVGQKEVVVIINDTDEEGMEEVLEYLPNSPTFQSSAGRQGGRTFHKTDSCIYPATANADSEVSERNVSKSDTLINRSNTFNLDEAISVPSITSVVRKTNDYVKPKGKSGKGGTSKGKGKLMMKR